MRDLRFALVGCGRIAKRHSELLGKGEIRGAILAAVCDIKLERAQAIGEAFDVPYFEDMHEMVSNVDLDVIVVLTESGYHADHVIALAKHGRHIVVEKPMAMNVGDADRMITACADAGVKLFVVMQNRFNFPVLKLREALEQGRFGKLVLGTVRVRWCRTQEYYDQDSWRGTIAMDGGVLGNQANHHVDLLEWIMGRVESVYALGRTALVDIESEDTAVVTIEFESGALGVIEATTATRPTDLEGSISILGEGGSVEVGGFAVNQLRTWAFAEVYPGDEEVVEKYSVNPPNVYGFGHQAYYDHVVDCISNNKAPLVDGVEARRTVVLLEAINRSMQTGAAVGLMPAPLCVGAE